MNKINYEIVTLFTDTIGIIDFMLEFDCFKDCSDQLVGIKNKLLIWNKAYFTNGNFNKITYEESLNVHNIIQEIRDEKIFDKKFGMESMLSDRLLIKYECLVKTINKEIS